MTFTRTLLAALAIAVPGIALAGMPAVGEKLGTTPDAIKAALGAAGCPVDEIEAEKGKIEAKCHDAAGKAWEVYIDPATGVVADVSDED
jgi:hypothetical protein